MVSRKNKDVVLDYRKKFRPREAGDSGSWEEAVE